MKRTSILFLILLLFWIIFSSYWYLKRKGHFAEDSSFDTPQVSRIDTTLSKPDNSVVQDSVTLALEYIRQSGIKTYYFEFASAKPGSDLQVDDYLLYLKYYLDNSEGKSVTVKGHSCSRGSAAANNRFSNQRAEKVKQFMVNAGIRSEQIKVISGSDSEPAASNETEAGRKLNRRAEIILN